jgi:galactokinase
MVDLEALKNIFWETYRRTPRLFAAPGRVNLIGEHTDYNEGFVLPIAVDRQTVVAATTSELELIQVHSINLGEHAKIDLSRPHSSGQNHWVEYVEGVARVLKDQGFPITGADLVISSDVPIGSGLSSSAALEMSVGFALLKLTGKEVDLLTLALAAQKAEHVYAGAKVGLMDQLASAFGKRQYALLIDCRSLERTLIKLEIGDAIVVVCDTNVRHKLAASEYNQRREECERGVEILRHYLPHIRALRDVSVADFKAYESVLPEPIRRRCRHVVYENERTLRAAEALRNGDLAEFGKLMKQSHESLRDDYEVSSRELDVMVEVALAQKGVIGARMTGGGFGGCTVNIVQRKALDEFSGNVSRLYHERTGNEASIYVVEAADGVHEIKQ